jgi:hypothetical protein
MADILPQPNRQPDSGKSFVSSILSKLPYVTDVLETDTNNPRYELFDRLSKKRELKIMQQSVITGPYMNKEFSDYYSPNTMSSDKGYHNFIYAQVDTDKIRRIAEYRRMAAFSEVADCLDAICDEFINKDEDGKVITIDFSSFTKMSVEEKSEIQKEFYKFINSFDLEHKGWGYCRQLLIEGEIFFENIIHEKKKDLGIIGVLSIPGELINPIYDNIQNNVIQNFIFQKPISLLNNPNNPTAQSTVTPSNSLQHQLVTLQGNQITYINSGLWNEDMSIRVPYIESCRRAYKQLSLIEDSIVIYRLVRAPERLKFVIDVGNMPPAKAEAYLRQLMQQYWTKKTYDSQSNTGGGASNVYDPQSMLDAYWFARRTGEQGSDVQVLPGGQNLGELKDLIYFVNKLYQSLGVPLSRLNPEDSFKDGSEILREELKFAKTIIRLQNQMAGGLKDAFITHLKIRGWWKEYRLHESYFDLNFLPPSNFFALRQNQNLELKFKNFNDISQNESISKTFAQRHYLNLSDSKISENMEWLRKDAALKWELDQIAGAGPNWREQYKAAEEAGKAVSDASSGFEAGGSASEIPEFGGAGTESGETAPEEVTPEIATEVPAEPPAPTT